MTDPHRLLGLAPGATADDIRAARRRLAKQLHPDTVAGVRARAAAEARMALVNEAADAMLAVALARVTAAAIEGRRPRQQEKPDGYWGTGDEPSAAFRIGGMGLQAGYELVMLGLANLGDPKDVDSPRVIEAHVLDPVPCFARVELVVDGDGVRCTLETAPVDGSRLTPPAPVILLNRLLQELRTLSG